MYQPAEDSYLMSRILKENIPNLLEKKPDLKFLEIGAGSGIHLHTAENSGIKKKNIFSCDIDKNSVEHCTLLGYNCIKSDLFEAFKGRLIVKGNLVPLQFGLIIFNPPYLPEDKYDNNLDTTGGKKGDEIILRFLREAKNHLEKDGKIFLITSTLTPKLNFEKLGYKAKEIGCEKLFFERLCVWELKISS